MEFNKKANHYLIFVQKDKVYYFLFNKISLFIIKNKNKKENFTEKKQEIIEGGA